MEIIKINSAAVEVTWQYIREFMLKGLDKTEGEYTEEDLLLSLLQGKTDLWIGVSDKDGIIGAFITQVIFYPQYKSVLVLNVGSKAHTIKQWIDLIVDKDKSPLINYAKEQKAKRIEAWVRDGWLKYLKNSGFRKYKTVVTREI